MKNLFLLLSTVLVFVFIAACSSDDETSQQEQPPGDFIITTAPDFRSVSLTWSVAEGEENDPIRYAILVDNELTIEDITERTYVLEDLEIATTYNLKVIAKNENGETAIETIVETLNPENVTFLVESLHYSQDLIATYMYNDEGQIKEANESFKLGERATYKYDNNGNIVREDVSGSNHGGWVQFTYENNQLRHMNIRYNQQDGVYSDYDFTSPDNYIVSTYDDVTQNSGEYEVTLERSNGKITSYQAINLNTQGIAGHFMYTYEDGNLVGITNVISGVNRTYEYDDKYNFFNQKFYFRRPGIGMPFMRTTFPHLYHTGFAPELMNHLNKNNPIAVYENGQLLHTVSYEYTEFDYPSKIYIDGSTNPWELTYTYYTN
ncbi:MAG: fibronectin type III domain-containing protein [Marinirhabdus sp.]|nr:fibronectin type III domain-containing protein [Marinirhabdus sp.]